MSVVRAVLAEPGRRQHARAADAVAAGGRAEQHGEVAEPGGPGQHEPVVRQQPEAEHVDERIVLIGGVEDDLATDRRDADGVAIAGDAGHDTFGDPAAPGVVERAEPERIHQRDGTSADGEDIAQDAADAGGRALIGLDGRRVVVALDAEGGGDAVADVDHPGALAGADQHVRCLGGQTPQVEARRLVRAVLGPHHRVHGQLEVVRRSAEELLDRAPPRRR